MSSVETTELQRRGTRKRGERTREKILLAAMKVIAHDGVRGATHRSVARQAGVQLSLTTYYFKNLEQLVSEAFQMFMDRDREDQAERWQQAFAYLDRFDPDEISSPNVQRRIIEYVTRQLVEHIREKLANSPEGLAIEHHFFFEALLDEQLKDLAQRHRQRLLRPIRRFCSYFSGKRRDTDAELLLGTITRLEYESLLIEPDAVDYRSIRQQLRRIVGWIVRAG
jgi:DNA-binding transcriptional regulator YbjK